MASEFCFVNNDNISEENLYKDRLHLLEADERILAKKIYQQYKKLLFFVKAQTEQSFLTKDTNKDTHSIDCIDLQTLKKDKLNYPRNVNLFEIRFETSDKFLEIVLSETKIDESFPSAQFNIHDYKTRNRRDSDKHGGGLIEFVRKGFITKIMK